MRNGEELPVDQSGNGERLRTLTFDFADAAMLYHAASIAASTIMMCGGGKAQARMLHYRAKFLEACPPGYQHFKHEEDIANIAIAMLDADKCTFQRIRKSYRDQTYDVAVQIGEKKWSSNLGIEHAETNEMLNCLKAIAPMNCEIEELEDKWDKW